MAKQRSSELDLKVWVDAFELLTSATLSSKSPKHYKEVLEFLKKMFSPDQIYFWKMQKEEPKAKGRGEGKQKFLSAIKTSLEEFNIYLKEFESLDFKGQLSFREGENLFLKLPAPEEGRFFCLIIKSTKVDICSQQDLMYFFNMRLMGILHLIDKVEAVQSLSFEDDVTGLYNQRYLNILLDQEIERYKRLNVSFSVLFIDVDHFKSVNDKNGHLVGSQVLKGIGEILKKSVRAIDYCFRYGGDEFLMVLTSTSTEQATIVAERVCKQVRETPFLVAGKKVSVTLSIGVATFPDHAQTKERILQVADEAMYCGKNLSRNVVYLAG